MLLGLVASALVMSAPAMGTDTDDPEAVNEVVLQLTGSAQLNELAAAGYDLEHDARRVPNGVEAPALVTASQRAELEALGIPIIAKADRWTWDLSGTDIPATLSKRAPAAPSSTSAAESFAAYFSSLGTLVDEVKPPVRIVRADYFTTKGQGFLYVEARSGQTTTGNIGMQLANDAGPGTPLGAFRTMQIFTDSGVYMFHRNLFKVSARPSAIRVTSPLGAADGFVSDWLQTPVTPLTDLPGYQSDFVPIYTPPEAVYARFDEIARQYPKIAEIVALPNKTNGYQRKAQGTLFANATTLSAATAAGASAIRVASTTGLAAGSVISIDNGANQERRTIATIVTPNPAAPAPNVTLTQPLTLAHANAAPVYGAASATSLQDAAAASAIGDPRCEHDRARGRHADLDRPRREPGTAHDRHDHHAEPGGSRPERHPDPAADAGACERRAGVLRSRLRQLAGHGGAVGRRRPDHQGMGP